MKLRERWQYSLGRVERAWILICTSGSFVLLLIDIAKNGHL